MLKRARFTHFHSAGRAAGIAETIPHPSFSTNAESPDFQTPSPSTEVPSPKQIYADNAIPGEVALVALSRRQRGFRLAVVDRLLTPSPDRVSPFCPHAEVCGGCNWQHLAYPAQLHWKRDTLVNALAKYGIETPQVPEVVPSPLLQGYRNKSEYAFSTGKVPRFGFHPKEDPAQIFACESCFLQPPHVHLLAQQVFNIAQTEEYHPADTLRSLQIRTTTMGETFCMLCFYTDAPPSKATQSIIRFLTHLQQAIPQVSGWFYTIAKCTETSRPFYPNFIHFGGTTHLEERIDDMHFRYSPQAFFQPNPLQATALYRYIARHAQLTGAETVYDLYTGVGTIACTLARHAKQVIGIEGNPSAIHDARLNATLNNLHNTHFITGDILETFTPSFVDSHPKAHLIILDPPRSGTLTEIKKALLYASPHRIIYVSCNPVSLAWDLKQLCGGVGGNNNNNGCSNDNSNNSGGDNNGNGNNGNGNGYRVTALQPFDMFPHTHHVETVCVLEKK